MSRTKLITYKSQNIFYMDFSNAKTQQEVAQIIEESIQIDIYTFILLAYGSVHCKTSGSQSAQQ